MSYLELLVIVAISYRLTLSIMISTVALAFNYFSRLKNKNISVKKSANMVSIQLYSTSRNFLRIRLDITRLRGANTTK